MTKFAFVALIAATSVAAVPNIVAAQGSVGTLTHSFSSASHDAGVMARESHGVGATTSPSHSTHTSTAPTIHSTHVPQSNWTEGYGTVATSKPNQIEQNISNATTKSQDVSRPQVATNNSKLVIDRSDNIAVKAKAESPQTANRSAPIASSSSKSPLPPPQPKTVKDAAGDLSRAVGKNRVSAMTPNGRLSVDLAGSAHFEKGIGNISTPHVKFQKLNTGPNGKSKLSPGSVRPATMDDVRTARKIINKGEN
ncbi:hypothetical protein [Methylobacterium sp. GC_Met_2]|uniref:hypothetical protein n=1 Tax=Methylobacterium sp. GC_Met_2 TaxID=2937376 RepID=UPI00226B3B49|nr:hypothetical protein [Methylobacterium sp. GC_Met_2]